MTPDFARRTVSSKITLDSGVARNQGIVCYNMEENKLHCNMTVDSCVRNNCTDNELGKIDKEPVVTTLRILPYQLPGSTDELAEF
jgi:hypothetical protein